MSDPECTCNTDGLCWWHQCECWEQREPGCTYHNELGRVGASNSYEYAQAVKSRP